MDVMIWIFIAIMFVIFELMTNTFVLICFSAASLAAAVLNYFGFDLNVQIIGFIAVAAVLILATRKFSDSLHPLNDRKVMADRLIGKKAEVFKKTDKNTFIVRVEGEEWSAHSNDSIEVGDIVKVVGINSIILIIEKED